MILTRRTYWSSGLITDREISFDLRETALMIAEQRRRIDNGPGIDMVALISPINGGHVIIKPTVKS